MSGRDSRTGPDQFHFLLNGHEELACSYDSDADVLYLWRGERARPAVSVSTSDGHLVRLDIETYDFVGVTIFEWRQKWAPLGRIELRTPDIQEDNSRSSGQDFSVERKPVAV